MEIQENQTSDESISQETETTYLGKELSNGEYLHFEHYSVEEGLSQSTVFCMVQDQQGYLWLGTEDGLNKFDGYSFTVYQHDPDDPASLSSNWVQSMLVDQTGTLWIGTRDGGLNRYGQTLDQFTRFQHDPNDPSSLSDDAVTVLEQSPDGMIWVGTGSGGLNQFDPESGHFIHFSHESEDPDSLGEDEVLSLYQSRDETLWIGTNGGGLNRYDPAIDSFKQYENNPGDAQSLIDNTVNSILEDSTGLLWIGTNAGLDRFDPEKETFTHFENDPGDSSSLAYDVVQTIFEDSSGSLWIGTYGGGVNYFDRESQSFSRFQNLQGDNISLSSDIILTIFRDREGVLWFGTIGGGVNKLGLERLNFTHYKNNPLDVNGLSNDMVRAFFHDPDGSIWIGTMFGGLNRFDPKTSSWQHYQHDPESLNSLSDNFVSTIYRDRSGVLWIGTIHGLDRFNSETETFTHFDLYGDDPENNSRVEVTAIYENQAGEFWVGTTEGLYTFDRQTESWGDKRNLKNSIAQNQYIYTLLEDKEEKLWLGTLGEGIYIYEPSTGEVSHLENDPDDPGSLSQNYITAMFIDDETGRVWIGTNSNGLDLFDPLTGNYQNFRESDGLPNDSIYCLLEDANKNIWISTNHGLSKFEPDDKQFTNYDSMDGLQSNEFNAKACLKITDEQFLFGGINGFNVFDPGNIKINPFIPPVVLTSLTINNKRVNLDQSEGTPAELTLNWPDNAFDFEYASLSFSQPELNQYAYFLEGFDETWKAVGNRRFGQYTNIPGGSYTLHVRGSNNDGVWNETGISLRIKVYPPFWQTPWFYGILVLFAVGGIYGIYKLRVRNLSARGLELEKQVQERTSELLQMQTDLKETEMEKAITEERNRLARDLHDSVTQSIYSLTLLAEAGQRLIRNGKLNQAEGIQKRLGEIAQQALQEMRLLVYELRPKSLENEGLKGALEHRLESVERRAGISAQLYMDREMELPSDVEDELFHIATEALNNALKHAKATEVNLSIDMDEDSLFLKIVDNGQGFNPEHLPGQGGMGILSMTERTEKLGGKINIKSNIGEGSEIVVIVPLISDDPRNRVNSKEDR